MDDMIKTIEMRIKELENERTEKATVKTTLCKGDNVRQFPSIWKSQCCSEVRATPTCLMKFDLQNVHTGISIWGLRGNPIIFNEEKILFLPDTATFADYDAVADTLGPIAEYMALYPNFRLLLAGTTATAGSDESCKQLSLMRADAVKNLLLDMGVDEKQITQTIGLGYDHKYHIPDIDSNGQQNANAAENRSVILFDANSEEAGALLSA